MHPPFVDFALTYASLGWFVFPVWPNQKTPIPSTGFHAATRDELQIRAWWHQTPNANIGIATDASGIAVYDVDVGDGKLGARSHGEIAHLLPATVKARTRSGGYHYYYVAPPGFTVRKTGIKPVGVTAPAGATGLDLLMRGYVLAPPSIVDGSPYEWLDAKAPLVPLPQFLIDAARRPNDVAGMQTVDTDGAILQGNRNNALYLVACRMRNAGMGTTDTVNALLVTNRTRVRPPLPDDEVTAIALSAAERAEFDTDETDARLLAVVAQANQAPQLLTEPTADGPDDASQVDALLDTLLLSKAAAQPIPPVEVHPTGINALDKALGGGFATRQLTTIMAGPSSGKSALGVAFARTLATATGDRPNPPPVLIVSTELELAEIAARYAAPAMHVPWRDIVRSAEHYAKVPEATRDVAVYVLDVTQLQTQFEAGLQQIYELAKRLEKRHGQAPVLLLDYLQELAGSVEASEKTAKVGQVAQALRVISQRVPCVALAVASVSRAGYGASLQAIREQNDPLAYIALAKESGQIEYASATVIFIDVEQEELTPNRVGRLVVCKSRHGTPGFVGIHYDPALGVFTEKEDAGRSMMTGGKNKQRMFERAKVMTAVSGAMGELTVASAARTAGVSASIVASMVQDGMFVQQGRFLFVPQTSDQHPEAEGAHDVQPVTFMGLV